MLARQLVLARQLGARGSCGLQHGFLVCWALGAAQGREWDFVGYQRARGQEDLLLRARRLHFPPRQRRQKPGGDAWPVTFWLEHGWLRPSPPRWSRRRQRFNRRRRAALWASVKRGTEAMTASAEELDEYVDDLLGVADFDLEFGGCDDA